MRKYYLGIVFCLLSTYSIAGEYWVIFKDKKGVEFDPYSYFDSKAIHRRKINGIPIKDTSDFPLNQSYVEAVTKVAKRAIMQSRWLNGVKISASSSDIEKIKQLEFVKEIKEEKLVASKNSKRKKADKKKMYLQFIKEQVDELEGLEFSKQNITGKGVRIAIFDAGFPGVDTLSAFKHLFENDLIYKTWDFVKNKENVYDYNSHGTYVLSCISGIYKGKKMGIATDSEIMLARTEVLTEIFEEEEYWLAAAEWSDKNGVDIISSSLGYTKPRYKQSDMDGESSLVAIAAKMASKKGILVINAMGNDGGKSWKIVNTPADAPEVLSVGGINFDNGMHLKFSSHGPNKKYELKPNICAPGYVAATGPRKMSFMAGTSFATPLIAGFAACTKQFYGDIKTEDLFKKLEESAHLYPYFDYLHGYGVPKASRIMGLDQEPKDSVQASIDIINNKLRISIDKKNIQDRSEKNILLYHIANKRNHLLAYGFHTLNEEENSILIDISKYKSANILRINFNGQTLNYKIQDEN